MFGEVNEQRRAEKGGELNKRINSGGWGGLIDEAISKALSS